MSETNEAIPTLIEFLYLSRERYRYSPDEVAHEVFENFQKNQEEPSCVEAIRTCLQRDRLFEQENAVWKEHETREYLYQFPDLAGCLLSNL